MYLCGRFWNKMKQVFVGSSPRSKIFYLFLFSFIGLIIGSGLLNVILRVAGINIIEDIWGIYLSTLVQSLFVFILPVFLVVSSSDSQPGKYLALVSSRNLLRDMLFGIAVFVASYIFVSFLVQWNKTIELPQAFHSIEQWMRNMEESAQEKTEKLLSGKSVWSLIANLFFVAVLAAVSEELFFRGALQKFLQEMTKNGDVAVWLSSFIFSAIHLQFYGFFPRLILGALLGYLFLYTRNLWIPILVHFINNASVIVFTFLWSETDWFNSMENVSVTGVFFISALISALLTVFLFRVYMAKSNLSNNNSRYDSNTKYNFNG